MVITPTRTPVGVPARRVGVGPRTRYRRRPAVQALVAAFGRILGALGHSRTTRYMHMHMLTYMCSDDRSGNQGHTHAATLRRDGESHTRARTHSRVTKVTYTHSYTRRPAEPGGSAYGGGRRRDGLRLHRLAALAGDRWSPNRSSRNQSRGVARLPVPPSAEGLSREPSAVENLLAAGLRLPASYAGDRRI